MSPSEALLYFTLQVTKAETDLKLSTPPAKVVVMNFNDAYRLWQGRISPQTAAMVIPCTPGFECDPTIAIMLDELVSGPKKLQCVARHEVSHIALGHLYGQRNFVENRRQHEAVKYLMKWTWKQDSSCLDVWGK